MNEKETELILNKDNSVYHLHLRAEHIGDTVLLVGDPARVDLISSEFDHVEYKISNREFVTHTGIYNGHRFTAISTGIGTDNLDIVINELDAAINIDPITKKPNHSLRSLNLIRLGTCGALQADLDVESIAITEYALGFDGVRHFYDLEDLPYEIELQSAFNHHFNAPTNFNQPYIVGANSDLLNVFENIGTKGITVTANGFFGPQGRKLRLPLKHPNMNHLLTTFQWHNHRIVNYEMESSALYALGRALGHRCLCLCVVIGNRLAGKFSKNYHPAVKKLIQDTLTICSS